ncbi:MAG: HD domain-containing protein [Clostridia bacterium]|nr:HD domain-containing protein [Oscillospiraceae bacterium]MBR6748590.1 HD domain-containing protein [Clostridia bacterium]
MSKTITYAQVRDSEEIKTYIAQADASLKAMGFTEHSFAHVGKCAHTASLILQRLGFPARLQELSRIAGYMHDIGNVINRVDHAQSGAMMAFRILDHMGMDPADIAVVVTAIGNHDEHTAFPVNEVAAALILADKTDVRRTRVRGTDMTKFDIHDRVNYAVESSEVTLYPERHEIWLELTIDTKHCAVMEYFEIFLGRMMLCRKAADHLGQRFKLRINGLELI